MRYTDSRWNAKSSAATPSIPFVTHVSHALHASAEPCSGVRSNYRLKEPAPVGLQAHNPIEATDAPTRWVGGVLRQVNADVDDLSNESARRGRDDLLEQLADAVEHSAGVICVDRAEATRMAGVPGLDQFEGGGPSPHLPDDDPIGSGPEGVHDRPLPPIDWLLDEDLQLVASGALELPHVLDDVEPVIGLVGDLGQDGVREGALPAAGRAADEDVGPVAHGSTDLVRLPVGEDSPGDV